MPVEQARVTPPNLNSSEYVKIPAVPIFDENCRLRRVTHNDGSTEVVRDCVDAERLQLICRNSAARERSGNYSLIFVGHTDDEKPEAEQPPVIGYADNYRMGEMDDRPVILVDYNIDKNFYHASSLERFRDKDDKTTILKAFPRRSAEIVGKMTETAFVDAIALLKRTPFRHLGLVTHAEDDDIDRNIDTNDQGGVTPQDIKVAKSVDLITLPSDVEGTNCFNCRFINKDDGDNLGFCENEKVKQYVNNRNCCALWDNRGVHRPWEANMNSIDRNSDNCGTGAGGLKHKEIHSKYRDSGYISSSHEKFPFNRDEKEKFLSKFDESQLSSIYNSILKHLSDDADVANPKEHIESTYYITSNMREKPQKKSALIRKIVAASESYIAELAEDESGGDEDGAYPTEESEKILNEIIGSAIHHATSKDKNAMSSCSCGGTCNKCKDRNSLTESENRIATKVFSQLKDFLLDPRYAIDRNHDCGGDNDEDDHQTSMNNPTSSDEAMETEDEKKRKENEEAGAASAPASTPTATNGTPAMADNPNPAEERDSYRLKYEDQLALTIDLQNQLKTVNERASKLQTELATEINRNSLSRRELTLKSLRDPANGGYKLSLEKEMKRIEGMSDDQFNSHIELIKENYGRTTDDDSLILEGTVDMGGANPDRPTESDRKQEEVPEHVRIQRFAAENEIKDGRKAVAEYYKKFPVNRRAAQ